MPTEKRLIFYADDLIKCLKKHDRRIPGIPWSITGIQNILKELKPVDVVEVVRCKECKFCERDHTLDDGGDEYYYCWHVVMEHGQARPNEFCCYGERKDND